MIMNPPEIFISDHFHETSILFHPVLLKSLPHFKRTKAILFFKHLFDLLSTFIWLKHLQEKFNFQDSSFGQMSNFGHHVKKFDSNGNLSENVFKWILTSTLILFRQQKLFTHFFYMGALLNQGFSVGNAIAWFILHYMLCKYFYITCCVNF